MSKSTTWPKIRKRISTVNGKKYIGWIVDCGIVDGKRVTKSFSAKQGAEKYAQEKRIARRKIGHDAMRLTDAQIKQAVEAFRILDDKGSIKIAAEFYMKHRIAEDQKITVTELLKKFLEKKASTGKRDRTLQDYRYRISKLSEAFGDTLVSDVTTSMLEKWMDDKGCQGLSRRNFKRNFGVFFNYAMKNKHTHHNPAKDIEDVTMDERTPKVLTIAQVKKLLETCAKHKEDSDYTPYFALAIFAGIRPEEIMRLDWAAINFTKNIVVIDGTISKTRKNRTVEMSENLIAWLLPYRKKQGPVVPAGKHFYTRAKALRKKAGLKDAWEADIMRHTFGTYHYAFHEDEGKTVKQMGNSSYVFQRHYNDGLISKADSREFWAIVPDRDSNVLQFQESA